MDWLDQELAFITWLYKYGSFLGSLKRKDFKYFSSRGEALKAFYEEESDKCLKCGGEYQQIGKKYNKLGHKILIDSCKNCGYVRER